MILDIGHGAGSFDFETAEAMLSHGMRPDVISSDIHQLSVRGPMFDLPTTLSKFLTLGMGLPDVIAAATSHPAAAMGLSGQVGSLAIGANADIALFRLEQGSFSFDDVFSHTRTGAFLADVDQFDPYFFGISPQLENSFTPNRRNAGWGNHRMG